MNVRAEAARRVHEYLLFPGYQWLNQDRYLRWLFADILRMYALIVCIQAGVLWQAAMHARWHAVYAR